MDFKEFASMLMEICKRSSIVKNNFLICTFIVNPKAGGFTIPSRRDMLFSRLKEAFEKAKKNPERKSFFSATALDRGGEYGNLGLVLTEKSGDAGDIALSVAEESCIIPDKYKQVKNRRPFYLIVTAGGDGTNREVLETLLVPPDDVRRHIAVLRLPFGTGNDGADARDLGEALDLLIEPAFIGEQRALKLTTARGGDPFYAFNILSVGLDAFVTQMTNKMKDKRPGDSYKLWVDIAALFYGFIYKVGYIDVRSLDRNGNEGNSFREKLLLLAAGVSGRRTYGSNQKILPDERNVCAIKQMSIFRKLKIKKLVSRGEHAAMPEAILWNASRIELSAKHPILAQMDGETELLKKEDFPAVIQLTEPVIQILQKK